MVLLLLLLSASLVKTDVLRQWQWKLLKQEEQTWEGVLPGHRPVEHLWQVVVVQKRQQHSRMLLEVMTTLVALLPS